MFLKLFHFVQWNVRQMPYFFLFSLHCSFTWSRQSCDQRFEFRMAEVSTFNIFLLLLCYSVIAMGIHSKSI